MESMRTGGSSVLALGLTVMLAQELRAEDIAVGSVTKVQNSVTAAQKGQTRNLSSDGVVLYRDKLKTGPGARLEAKLADGTVLTLGEKGKLTVDEFVYRPGESGNSLVINASKGAFLFVGGKVEAPTGGNVKIETPVGTLGVRGTTVWGGHIDGGFGVLVLKGEVWIDTPKGRVTLREGNGTMVYNGKGPAKAASWPADRTKRAVATVSFPNAN